MPGISLICDFSRKLEKQDRVISNAFDSLLYYNDYKKEIIFKSDSLYIGFTSYEEYPINIFKKEDYLAVLEGNIYGKSYQLIDHEIDSIMSSVNENEMRTKATEWLTQADGDFVLILLDKRKRKLMVINDMLGHLPLYIHKGMNNIIISREIRLFEKIIINMKMDRMAMAQNLLFGHQLGRRTLFENINKLGPATYLEIDLEKKEYKINNLFQFNFENKQYGREKINDNVDNLIELLNKACIKRSETMNDYKNVLGLTGGLDSRAVASCLKNNRIPFTGSTFSYLNNRLDVSIAEKLSDVYQIDWKLIELNHPIGRDVQKLLEIKGGMNYLAMSYILPYFNEVKKAFGSKINYYTGDTGLAMRYIIPRNKVNKLDDLVNYVLFKNNGKYSVNSDAVFTLNDVERLLNINKDDIIDELKNKLMSYPESSMKQKYAHFVFDGYWFNWHYEGMDRNRYYFWLMSPLESFEFIYYGINCNDEYKKYNELYRKFITKLDYKAAKIKTSMSNKSLTSFKDKTHYVAKHILYKSPILIRNMIGRIIHKRGNLNKSRIYELLREQINNCRSVNEYLICDEIRDILTKENSALQYSNLLTITALIENFKEEASIIDKYAESKFY